MAVDPQQPADEVIAELREEIARLRDERDRLRGKLDALLHQLYGRRTERVVSDDLGPLFADLEQPDLPLPPPPDVDDAPDDEEEVEVKGYTRKPRSRGAPRLPDDLREVVEVIEPTEEERACSCCSDPRDIIGFEETRKLEFEPASFYVRVIRRPKMACKRHEEAGVVTPALPPQVIEKGLAGASMLAQVVTAKYRDHLPLYRQARILQRAGIDIPESTLCDWIRQSDELLGPIPRAVMTLIRESGYISTDDTKVTLLCPGGPRGSREARLWAYLGEQPGDVVFDFTEGRSGEGPKRMLAGYEGYLQADAYSAYDALFRGGKIIEAGCMAHARRKFFDAKDRAPDEALPTLQAIRALYRVERECKEAGLTADDRLARRVALSKPTFDRLHEWLVELKSRVLPKSPIGKAVGYFVKHALALGRFLENGRLEIDNNRCERTMRQVAVGRKNWLFAGSEAGGRRAATLYSLTVGCWEIGIDPFVYLTHVLQRIGSTPSSRIAELTPRGWAASRRQS